jgi:hypothetical protein
MNIRLKVLGAIILAMLLVVTVSLGTGIARAARSAATAAQPTATAEPKPETTSMTGELVDMWCYMDHKARGADHKTCATGCAKAGNAIGLLDSKGQVYLLQGGKMHDSGNSMFVDKMAETVTVKGKLVKLGGIQTIFVESVTPPAPAAGK